MRMRFEWLLPAVLSGLAPAAVAAELDVPAQFPTIQSAIDAAAPGDTVVVEPGHYAEHVDFHGKAISVASSGGAAVTVIDGGGTGSVVTFASGETAGSVLSGFTITGGAGSAGPGFVQDPVGGGIKISSAAPQLHELVISGNAAATGAGVFVSGTGPGPRFVHCELSANAGDGFAEFNATVRLEDCDLSANQRFGIFGEDGALTLTSCSVNDNFSIGVSFSADTPAFTGTLEMDDCEVTSNASALVGGFAISLFSDFPFSFTHVHVRNTLIRGNSGGVMSAVDAEADSGTFVQFDRCVFTANGPAGVPVVATLGSVSFTNCTFADNLGPVATSTLGSAFLGNCISHNNPGTTSDGVNATWSDIEGGAPGVGNIAADPLFKNAAGGDFRLSGGSPCIDSADPTLPLDPDGTHADMGALTFTPFTDLGFALPGAAGAPQLSATGALLPGEVVPFKLSGAKKGAPFVLIAGASELMLPFKGGTLVPAPDVLLAGTVSPLGVTVIAAPWPAGVPHGFIVWMQFWIADASGPKGYAASNGLAAEER